jgi:hypothetical protein
MSKKCPKCGHERTADDVGPDWQCPACGVAYSKVKAPTSNNNDLPRLHPRPSKTKSSNVGIASLVIVSAACLAIGYFAGREHIKYELRARIASAVTKAENIISSRDQTITIFMQGDPGTRYSGHIEVISSNGTSKGETIEGAVPAVYTLDGAIVSASFQKSDDNSNTLLVLITDEQNYPDPVKVAKTESPFGVAAVTLGR